MKTKSAVWILCTHAALLLLASTRFSMVSWLWGKRSLTCDYFQYAHQNGWGYQYHSDYSPAVVLTYIVCFLVGILGYRMAGKRVRNAWNTLAVILCVLRLISFLIEGSHWLWEHHLSWIAICPAASLLLVVVAVIQLKRSDHKAAEPSARGNATEPRASD